jgi:HEAT repeat protein
MMARNSKLWSACGLCLWMVAAAGCAAPAPGGFAWFGGWSEKPDPDAAPTPAQRMADLKSMAENASKSDTAEQERVSALLADGARKELDPLIRAQTVRTLGAYPTATARAALAGSLQDSDRDVRIAACEAIVTNRGPDAVRLLSDVLATDSDFDVRMAAARGLGDIEDPAAVAGLAAGLDDPDPAMQRRAVESLTKVTGRSYGNDVNAWRLYVQGQAPEPKPLSLAERLRRLF